MNFVSLDFIQQVIEDKKCPYWVVKAKDGKTLINEYQLDDYKSEKDSAAELVRTIEAQEPGEIIYIQISSKTKQEKKDGGGGLRSFEYRYKCGMDKVTERQGNNYAGNQLINQQTLALLETIKKLELQLMEQKNQQQMNELSRKIDEMKNDSPLEKYLPAIISGMGWAAPQAQSQPVAGISGTEQATAEQPKTAKEKVQDAVNRLLKVDRDLPNTLQSLASFAEKDPNKYLSFLPMLKTL